MKRNRKMTLKRETLHTLDEIALSGARGGQQVSGSGSGTSGYTVICAAAPMPGHDPKTTPGLFYPCGLP